METYYKRKLKTKLITRIETTHLFLAKSEAVNKAIFLSAFFRCSFFIYFNLSGHYIVDHLFKEKCFSGEEIVAEFERGIEKIV